MERNAYLAIVVRRDGRIVDVPPLGVSQCETAREAIEWAIGFVEADLWVRQHIDILAQVLRKEKAVMVPARSEDEGGTLVIGPFAWRGKF